MASVRTFMAFFTCWLWPSYSGGGGAIDSPLCYLRRSRAWWHHLLSSRLRKVANLAFLYAYLSAEIRMAVIYREDGVHGRQVWGGVSPGGQEVRQDCPEARLPHQVQGLQNPEHGESFVFSLALAIWKGLSHEIEICYKSYVKIERM